MALKHVPHSWIFIAGVYCVLIRASSQQGTPSPEPYYGTFVGALPDPEEIGVKGDVYIINITTLQVIGFRYSGEIKDLYFCLDTEDILTEKCYKVITFEYGDQPLQEIDQDRIVLWSSHANVENLRSIGLWSESQQKSYSSVSIPSDSLVPYVKFLPDQLRPTAAGRRYSVYSGPIMAMDRRRLKVFGFIFDTVRAPRTYFFVGRGLEPKKHNGKEVAIRGFESPNYVPAIHDAYTGNQDIILELPEDYDIYHIDWISVFCSQFNIDFGHVKIGADVPATIPPYVPLQRKHDQKAPPVKIPWPLNILSGLTRTQFTFQLGPPGLDKGYGKWARAEPAKWVWYVNGYMTPQIWLQRGTAYSFVVEGGDQPNEYGQINALYITNSSEGGYGIQPDYEKENAAIFAGLKNGKPLNEASSRSFGRNCTWIPLSRADADSFDSFLSFKRTLRLKCEGGKTGGQFEWTPNEATPNTVYYQSYAAPHMGFEMIVVDEIPSDLPDAVDSLEDTSEPIGNNLETEEEENENASDDVRPGGGNRRESSSQIDFTTSKETIHNGAALSWKASSNIFLALISFTFIPSLVYLWLPFYRVAG